MAAKKDDFSVKHINPKLGGERAARNPNGPTSTYDLVEQMEFLYVYVEKFKYNSLVKPRTLPIVEITLGNYKSSTKTLPIGPEMDWNQVFIFEKSKGNVLTVTLKADNTVIGKQNFKIATDIPTKISPDSNLAAQNYSMHNAETGIRMDLYMSVWFGTQYDGAYSRAWFADSSEVSASCVNNTRSKTYLAPMLFYVRVTIVSGHDLFARDRNRTPFVYVKAILGNKFALKTDIASGSNPSWNKDLIFVASDMNDTVEFSLMDRLDDQHEECIGKLKKKLSEMTLLKVPGSAPALFYDIEPAGKVEPVGDTRRFSSRLTMKLAVDQTYHVFDECSQYSSDYRAFAKGLWPVLLGKLEIGILGATGLKLPRADDPKKGIDSYLVAKYGNKWARTRTVVDSTSPKWNEQHSFDVYEQCTVLTLGVYDNRNIVSMNPTNDVPIGKVRIPLRRLQWDRLYTSSLPILVLSSSGLKKLGEIQIAIRCVRVAEPYPFYTAPTRWMLPKAHYKSPLSVAQIEQLRAQAVQVNCMNLAKTEPPLRNEVVMDILKPKNQNFSMRKTKANYERVYRLVLMLFGFYTWFHANVVSTKDLGPKFAVLTVVALVFISLSWIMWIALLYFIPWYGLLKIVWELLKYGNRKCLGCMVKPLTYDPPPLVLFDLKISKLDTVSLDELAEEFDSFPSSELDVNVVRMRYDRLRKVSAIKMSFLGDLASQGERLLALLTFLRFDELVALVVLVCCINLLFFLYFPCPIRVSSFLFLVYWVNFPCLRNDLPSVIRNFFRRLPTNEDLML